MERAADLSRQPTGETSAVLDACVLVPFTLRGLLLQAADRGAFQAVWSEPILSEVKGVLLGKGMLDHDQWAGLNGTLRRGFPQSIVPTPDVRRHERAMTNHPKDRHVAAAAVASGSSLIVTNNLKDFRPADLEPVGLRAIHPDTYLLGLLDRAPELMRSALHGHVTDMREESRWTEGQVLGHLVGRGRGRGMAREFARQAEATFGIRAVPPPGRDPPRSGQSRTTTRIVPSQGLARGRSGRDGRSI